MSTFTKRQSDALMKSAQSDKNKYDRVREQNRQLRNNAVIDANEIEQLKAKVAELELRSTYFEAIGTEEEWKVALSSFNAHKKANDLEAGTL